jgi:hypothetical protein
MQKRGKIKSRRSCKHGKLKRSVKTKSGRRRTCKKKKSKKKTKRKSKKRKSKKRKYKVTDLSKSASKNIAKNMKGTIDQRIRRVRNLNIPERSKRDIIRELEHLRTWMRWRSQPDSDEDDRLNI